MHFLTKLCMHLLPANLELVIFFLFYSSVAPRIHFKQKNECDHRYRLGKGKGTETCLQVANRKKKLGQQGFQKDCKHIHKQTEAILEQLSCLFLFRWCSVV